MSHNLAPSFETFMPSVKTWEGVAVIGANFGDEGKGATVNYLASSLETPAAVVRFNGGPQAGHTVEAIDKEGNFFRHIHSSVPSGSLAGVAGHIAETCLIEPFAFLRELKVLPVIANRKITVDPNARLITPFDLCLNQLKEQARGVKRHGSCGFGVHEAMVRELGGKPLCIKSILKDGPLIPKNISEPLLAHFLEELRNSPEIQSNVTLFKKGQKFADHGEELTKNFIDALYELEKLVKFRDTLAEFSLATNSEETPFTVIFEGAQGLLLDQNNKEYFPHVTHSNTGLENAVFLANQNGGQISTAYFVTRPYLTRHGAGSFGEAGKELSWLSNFEVVDPTNIHNEFQGKLRVGEMYWTAFKNRVQEESSKYGVNPVVVLTCLDQHVPGQRLYIGIRGCLLGEIPQVLANFLEMPVMIVCGVKKPQLVMPWPTGTIFNPQ